MNSIQFFSNPSFGQIRVSKDRNDNPTFCLSDLCRVLDLRQGDVRQRLDEGVVSTQPLDTPGGIQQANFVNEDGLYDVILDSRKPEAKRFRKWVTSEILPSVRKNGGYIMSVPEETPEQIMARALVLAQQTIVQSKERAARLEQENRLKTEQLEEQAPRVLFAQAVETSSKSILVGELARLIAQNGVVIGQNRLFKWLRANGYLLKKTEAYNQPTQRSMEQGLFEIKKTSITKPDGTVLVTCTTKVTGKGQIYFVNKFLYNSQQSTKGEVQ